MVRRGVDALRLPRGRGALGGDGGPADGGPNALEGDVHPRPGAQRRLVPLLCAYITQIRPLLLWEKVVWDMPIY